MPQTRPTPADPVTRRAVLATGLAAGALAITPLLRAQPPRLRLRMLLNTGLSSPQAWLWLAQSRGYLDQEGIELDLTPGAGAYTAAPRAIEGGFDLAYGDVNSLIEEVARRPEAAPRGVFMMFNASPSCIAVRADGPLRRPQDLLGRRLIGHGSDVALRTFGALCLHQGLDRQQVKVDSAWAGMAGMVEDVLAGRADGAFGYVSTFTGALTSADPALLPRVRFLTFAEFAPDLYGSVLMASRRLLLENPSAVARLVRAVQRGAADMLREPEAAMQALARVAPGLDSRAERARLKATVDLEMNPALPPGMPRAALGDVDDGRMNRAIGLMVRANGLPRVPALAEVFTREHLPALRTAAAPIAASARRAPRTLRLLLNTSLSGPVAFFVLAQDRGYLRDEQLDLRLSSGPGAAAMVPLVRDGAYDAGYGDLSALIERIARGAPDEGPVALYTTFNVVPFTIAVAAQGPIKSPQDLPGKRIAGHASDAALLTFDLYAQAAGIDAGQVQVDGSMGGMGQATADMLRGTGADGVFGFVNTIIASATPLGVDPRALRFLNWSEVLPDMYGNTLFVTRESYRREPQALHGLVRAVNRGLVDTVREPKAAIDALLRHAPGVDRTVNLRRLKGTLAMEMAHPEGARIGVGDMDDERLARLIALIVRVKRLPRTPTVREVFDRSFLPPLNERVRNLAR
jgi:NitT/TauT family transport system substrate-binding protein